ncbi:hypothetical protein ACNS7O_17950 (plasmid) [Haloferacaceae archaeon DSL9]
MARTRFRTNRRHDAPVDPYRIYRVDPDRITQSISWQQLSPSRGDQIDDRFLPPKYYFAGAVLEGDWDLDRTRFEDSVVYTSFVAHFRDGVPWDETALYRQTVRLLDRGETLWGCRTPEDCQRRFAEIDRLYEDLARGGYRTQSDLRTDGVSHPLDHARSSRYNRIIEGEIAVMVGRDGELLFYDGRNRLAIAKLLDLRTVPVVILTRHRRWQRLRDGIARGERAPADLPGSLSTHPDLPLESNGFLG